MESLLTVLIPIIALAIVVILAKRVAAHTFRCRHCAKEFRIKWTKVVVTKHSDHDYMLVCPHCKAKDWCTEQFQK